MKYVCHSVHVQVRGQLLGVRSASTMWWQVPLWAESSLLVVGCNNKGYRRT